MNIPNTHSAAWILPGLPALPKKKKRRIPADEIMDVVATYYHMSVKRMKLKRRTRAIVRARQVATYFLCLYTDLTVTKIGAIFEQDHTTIIFSREFIRSQLSLPNEVIVHADISNIEQILKNLKSS